LSETRTFFVESKERFESAVVDAVEISGSRLGIVHTGRQNRALFVFSKLISHCMATLLIVGKYDPENDGEQYLDHASIGVLGRSIIDATLMTLYVSEMSLKRDEWDLRRQILYLHDLTTRKRFLKNMMNVDDGEPPQILKEYPRIKDEIVSKIKSLAEKQGFNKEQTQALLKGLVFINGVRGAAREAGINVDLFSFHQSYLSNWVHSHPVSFIRADHHGISFDKASEYQVHFAALVLDFCAGYVELAKNRMNEFTGKFSFDPIGQLT